MRDLSVFSNLESNLILPAFCRCCIFSYFFRFCFVLWLVVYSWPIVLFSCSIPRWVSAPGIFELFSIDKRVIIIDLIRSPEHYSYRTGFGIGGHLLRFLRFVIFWPLPYLENCMAKCTFSFSACPDMTLRKKGEVRRTSLTSCRSLLLVVFRRTTWRLCQWRAMYRWSNLGFPI